MHNLRACFSTQSKLWLQSLLGVLGILWMLCSCSRPIVVHPPSAVEKEKREALILDQVRRLGQNGDWLVIRGYHATDHLVSAITNAPFSHAAVLDLVRDQVIEAEAPGVHAAPLMDLVKRSHRLMLIRPMWAIEQRGQEALARARELVGKRYDFLGLVGLNQRDRYYCTELAVAIYRSHARHSDHIPPIIPPHQLHYWGTILFDSGAVLE